MIIHAAIGPTICAITLPAPSSESNADAVTPVYGHDTRYSRLRMR
jgi:hypothetical protein